MGPIIRFIGMGTEKSLILFLDDDPYPTCLMGTSSLSGIWMGYVRDGGHQYMFLKSSPQIAVVHFSGAFLSIFFQGSLESIWIVYIHLELWRLIFCLPKF